MELRQRTGRTSRRRWSVGALLILGCGCAAAPEPVPQPQPGFRTDLVLADEGAPGGEKPPTDFLDFPAAPDLLPRDYVMEETVGPLKGCVTKFYRVRNQSGQDLLALLNNWKSERGRILNVPQHNMLIITEEPDRLPLLERVLAQLDVVPPQVEIEAKVIEILETTGFEYGFEFFVDRSPASNSPLRGYSGQFNSNSYLESLANSASPFQGAQLNWAAVGDVIEEFGDFEFIMRALESEGYAEVVSAPRIVCRSGQKALLRTSTKLPIQDFILQSTNNTRITTRFEEVGVTLEVTPNVVGRDAISVEVRPVVSTVVQFVSNASAGGIPVPVIAERSASTRVDIRNGELLVIGGLLDKQIRTSQRGLPILGSLPLIGLLFSSRNDAEQKTNVVFILRLRLLTSAEKARSLERIPVTRDEKVREAEGEGD